MGHVGRLPPDRYIMFIDILTGSLWLDPTIRAAFAISMAQPEESVLQRDDCWDGRRLIELKWHGRDSGRTYGELLTVLASTGGAADLAIRWSDGKLTGLRVVNGVVKKYNVEKILLYEAPPSISTEE